MSEGGSPEIRLPNKVTEFVLDSVDTWDRLNAPKLPRHPHLVLADEKFRNQLAAALQNKTLSETVRPGGTMDTRFLVGNDDIVIKRLPNSAWETDYANPNACWNDMKGQYENTKTYFGPRFVPPTEFIELDYSLSDEDRQAFLPNHEFVVVQERVPGEDYNEFSDLTGREISPQLKTEMIACIRSYEEMMHKTGSVIENQMIIDYQTGKISVVDTNDLYSFNLDMRRSQAFWEAVGVNPRSIHNSQDVINKLKDTLPELEPLRDADYSTFVAALDENDDEMYGQIFRRLSRQYPGNGRPSEVAIGFEDAINCLNIAPLGEHNQFIKKCMADFGITDRDLVDKDDLRRHELIALIKANAEDLQQVKSGDDMLVYTLQGSELMFKRLRTARIDEEMDQDRYFKKIQVEDWIVRRNLGEDFVHQAQFIEMDAHLQNNAQEVRPGKEYFMVQKQVKGTDYFLDTTTIPTVSPELKTEMVRFITGYEQMMRDSHLVIDDQLKIDFDEGTIKVVDTNHLIGSSELLRNARSFMQAFNIAPESLTNSDDIIKALSRKIPKLKDLRKKNYTSVMHQLTSPENTQFMSEIFSDLYNRDPRLSYGFQALVAYIAHFPPEGHHNVFITKIMDQFDISDAELQTQ